MTGRDSSPDHLQALMKAAQGGDAAAYAQLLKLILPAIRRFVHARWLGSIEGEDLVQDILLSLHSVRHTYDPERPFSPWLYAIVRHRLLDAQRKAVRKSRNEVVTDNLPETFAEDETNWLDASEGDVELMRTAIEALPANQRQAMELLKLQDMSLKEASAASGLSITTLKISVHRAMKTLRAVLVAPQGTEK